MNDIPWTTALMCFGVPHPFAATTTKAFLERD
jgi:hypothetical protein